MELEQALERIIELESQLKEVNDQNESLKVKNDSLQSEIKTHSEQIQNLKQMNMRYFERLTMETKTPSVKEDLPLDNKTEEPQSWDSFMNEWK